MIRTVLRAVLFGSDMEQALVVGLMHARLPRLVMFLMVEGFQWAEREGMLE